MKAQEANKIIAEYMGYRLSNDYSYWIHKNKAMITIGYDAEWDQSLDALVPVWNKIGAVNLSLMLCPFEKTKHNIATLIIALLPRSWSSPDDDRNAMRDVISDCLTIQEAAAIATAKAIQDISDEQ